MHMYINMYMYIYCFSGLFLVADPKFYLHTRCLCKYLSWPPDNICADFDSVSTRLEQWLEQLRQEDHSFNLKNIGKYYMFTTTYPEVVDKLKWI